MAKTIFITGASSGIGRTTAQYFHEQGWNVVATMRNPEQEQEFTKLDNMLVTKLDVTNYPSINQAVDEALSRFDAIDVLLNNAGYGAYGPLEVFSMERIERQFNTNVIGLMAVTKALLPHMRKNQSGTIVNISSIGGQMTFPLGSLYHGTKFAVEGISEALHYELEPIGIKVKIVQPGLVRTDFGGRSFDMAIDENIQEYLPTAAAVGKLFEKLSENMSEPDVVAKVIWQAVHDTTPTLRYRAGDDAVEILDNRKKYDDVTFINSIKKKMDNTHA